VPTCEASSQRVGLSTSVLRHAGHYKDIVQARDMKGRNR